MALKDSIREFVHRIGPYGHDSQKSIGSNMQFDGYYGAGWEIFGSDNRSLTAQIGAALRNFAGTHVDWFREAGDLALSALVMPVVRWHANSLPEAPLQVVETDEDGRRTPIRDHDLPKLLAQPNPFFSDAQFWDAFSLSSVCSGDAYFIKKYNSWGQPNELWWVPPYLMRPYWPPGITNVFIQNYLYKIAGQSITVPVKDVFHYREGIDHRNMGRTGMSPLAAGMREIVGDSEWATYQVALAKRSGVPPFLLTPKQGTNMTGFGPAEAKRLREEFDADRMSDNRGKSKFHSVALDVTRLGQNPKELMLGDLRYSGQEIISSLTGLPGEVLNFGSSGKRSAYNNMTEANARAYEAVLIPLYRKLQRVLDKQLLPDFYPDGIVPPNVSCYFDVSKIQALQEDINSYSVRIVDQYYRGVISRAEAKDKLKYPFDPVKDDVYYTDLVQNRFGAPAAGVGDGHGNLDATNKDDGKSKAKQNQQVSTGSKTERAANLAKAAKDLGLELVFDDAVESSNGMSSAKVLWE